MALKAPMASPMPAGRAALPMADAATWRLTAHVVAGTMPATEPAPTLWAVVRMNRGKIGAAASPKAAPGGS